MPRPRPSQVPLNTPDPVTLLDSYRVHLIAARKRPDTVRGYLIGPRLFLTWGADNGLPALDKVDRRYIERWLATLGHLSSHTQRAYAEHVRLWFRWMADEGDISSDPTERLSLPAVDEPDKDVVDAEVIRDVLAGLEKAKRWRDLAMIALLYDTGMRAGELCSLKREDCDFEVGTVRLQAVNTKGRFPRVVPISPACVRNLDRYLRRRTDREPWLFLSKSGPMTAPALYRTVRKVFAETGMTIGPHDLRHTSATHMSGDVATSDLQTIFGWRNPVQARHYTRQAHVANAIAAHRKASPLERLGK